MLVLVLIMWLHGLLFQGEEPFGWRASLSLLLRIFAVSFRPFPCCIVVSQRTNLEIGAFEISFGAREAGC
jgi:hypothetical protein